MCLSKIKTVCLNMLKGVYCTKYHWPLLPHKTYIKYLPIKLICHITNINESRWILTLTSTVVSNGCTSTCSGPYWSHSLTLVFCHAAGFWPSCHVLGYISQGGFPLASPRFMIRSTLLPWWSCFCFTGMVSASHAKPTASTYWRN